MRRHKGGLAENEEQKAADSRILGRCIVYSCTVLHSYPLEITEVEEEDADDSTRIPNENDKLGRSTQ